jgi:protein SCO1
MARGIACFLAVASIVGACTPARPETASYELSGQIVAIRPEVAEVTIRHGDIAGFMPAMTMPFRVQDRRLLDGRSAGDLVKATLVVTGEAAYLSSLESTGHAALAEPVATPPVTDADLLKPGGTVPDEALVDQNGRAVRLSAFGGSALAITFIYTRCPMPEFCPLMDRNFAAIQQQVKADDRLRRGVRLLSISFDPEFDTPAVLDAHAHSVGADPAIWTFLTGTRSAIDRVVARFGLVVMREAQNPSAITHNLRTAIVDREMRLVRVYEGNDWTPDQIVGDLRAVAPAGMR